MSYSGDDGFEFFGGTVNAKYLISHRTLDDDFDTDFGYSGKIQFAVCLRDPNAADVSASQGFESDNDATGTGNTPKTSPLFSNVTLVGPKVNNADVVNTNYRRALHLRRNTRTSLYNSIVMGWPGAAAQSGIYLDGDSTANNAANNLLQIRNVILAGKDTVTTNATMGFNALAWFDTPAFGNTRFVTSAEVRLANPFNLTNPDFRPLPGSPALAGVDFTNPRLTDPFFTPTTYRGAFGSTRWDLHWSNYNPQYTTNSIISDVEVKRASEAIPTAYLLEQNYPNPFNPSTVISFQLPVNSEVTLSIFNTNGQLVKKLVAGEMSAGRHHLVWDATDDRGVRVASGVYLYVIKAGEFTAQRKLVLMK